MDFKKYDLIDHGDSGSASIEGSHYPVPQNGIGNQPIGQPGAAFNRKTPNSYPNTLQPSDLMNPGRVGKMTAGLGVIGIVLSTYKNIQDSIHDHKYGDFHFELMKTMEKTLLTPDSNGEIQEIYWELNFDDDGYANIYFQTGPNLGTNEKADYKHQIDFRAKGQGLSAQKYKEWRSKAEQRIEQHNIKEFKDRAGTTSGFPTDYKDVPIMNGGGSGGPSTSRKPTAIV